MKVNIPSDICDQHNQIITESCFVALHLPIK